MAVSLKEKPDSLTAGGIILMELAWTGTAIGLSLQENLAAYGIGQVLFAVVMFHWFVIQHDLGHGSFFRSRFLNAFFGHIASLFSLIPFFPWQRVHHLHHVWTGWKGKDPTVPAEDLAELSPALTRVMDFCWKYWIPVFVTSFVILTFWNIPKLNRLSHPNARKRNLFSILFLVLSLGLLFFLSHGVILRIWLPAFLLYISASDPILLSQHAHLDLYEAEDQPVRSFPYREQNIFSRTLVYPGWVSKYLLYHFDKHGLHHQHPGIPFYRLGKRQVPDLNTIGWKEWLSTAKRMPASVLIFQSYRDTGISL